MEQTIPSEQKLANSLRHRPEFKKAHIRGFSINFIKAGSGSPVILIHGGNLGWGQWYRNIDSLADHFTVYAIDLPGGGRSTRIDFSKLDFEDHFVGVVEDFILDQRFSAVDVIGSSNGGWIALRLGINNNPAIRKIVAVDSVGLGHHVSFSDRIMSIEPIARFMARTVFKPHRKNTRLEILLRSVFHDKKIELSEPFLDYFYDTMKESHNVLFISRLLREAFKKSMLLIDKVAKIQNETLIVWGEYDPLMPLKKYAPYFSKIPNVKICIIPDAGHISPVERPEIFNIEVLDFLRGRPKVQW